jgi:hypothetical protein
MLNKYQVNLVQYLVRMGALRRHKAVNLAKAMAQRAERMRITDPIVTGPILRVDSRGEFSITVQVSDLIRGRGWDRESLYQALNPKR